MRTGDHLVSGRVGYKHHGLYIGADQVIHYLQEGVESIHQVSFREINLSIARNNLADGEWVSGVGHADTAAVFSSELGLPVECNRMSVTLQPGDRVLVGQYTGPRLPEGATIQWWLVKV